MKREHKVGVQPIKGKCGATVAKPIPRPAKATSGGKRQPAAGYHSGKKKRASFSSAKTTSDLGSPDTPSQSKRKTSGPSLSSSKSSAPGTKKAAKQ